jgi:hypothetical protein
VRKKINQIFIVSLRRKLDEENWQGPRKSDDLGQTNTTGNLEKWANDFISQFNTTNNAFDTKSNFHNISATFSQKAGFEPTNSTFGRKIGGQAAEPPNGRFFAAIQVWANTLGLQLLCQKSTQSPQDQSDKWHSWQMKQNSAKRISRYRWQVGSRCGEKLTQTAKHPGFIPRPWQTYKRKKTFINGLLRRRILKNKEFRRRSKFERSLT